MARPPIRPSKAKATANATPNFRPTSMNVACIGIVESDGSVVWREESYFLLNPSSLDESKSANWIPSSIPGLSDPVLQWISSGPRTLTFEALVTKDISKTTPAVAPKAPDTSFGAVVGKIAEKFTTGVIGKIPKVPTSGLLGSAASALGLSPPPSSAGEKLVDNLSIARYLNYYRSLLYPTNTSGRLAASPKLVALYFGNSLSNSTSGKKVGKKDTLWVVTGIKIKITKQLPDLTPMEAVVNFELMEYSRGSRSVEEFYG